MSYISQFSSRLPLKKLTSAIAASAVALSAFAGPVAALADAPLISQVEAVPNSGTLTTGSQMDVYFQEGTGAADLSGSCQVNGEDASALENLSGGLYKVAYVVGGDDEEQEAGSVSIDCTFQNSLSETSHVTAFTAANNAAIDTNGDGTIGESEEPEEPEEPSTPSISISSVAAMPNSGTLSEGGHLEVYFQETDNEAGLSLDGACLVNGKDAGELSDLTGGLYKVTYEVGAGDNERESGTVPVSCSFTGTEGATTTVSAFTDSNTVAIDTNDDGTIGESEEPEEPEEPTEGSIHFSAVAAVPNSGTLGNGDSLEIYFQEAGNRAGITVDGTCSVNGVAMVSLQDLTGGLYKTTYVIGASDTERAAGTIPVDCNFVSTSGATTSVMAFTDSNTLAIDTNEDGTIGGTVGSDTEGEIGGDVEGGENADAALAVTSVTQVRSVATANNTYEDGWAWTFNVTVPNGETSLSMKFGNWLHGNGINTVAAADNIRISSAQASSASPATVTSAGTYTLPLELTDDLDSGTAGRQVQVLVETRVPAGTLNGSYTNTYGVRSN